MTIIQMLLGRDRGPHTGRIIKQVDETRSTGGAIPIDLDDELFFAARANTLYEINFVVFATFTGNSHSVARMRPHCSTAVSHAALRITRSMTDLADGWPGSTPNTEQSESYTTIPFNDDDRNTTFGAAGAAGEAVLGVGMIKTNTAGTIGIKWGTTGGSGTMTLLRGSFLRVREMEEI